MKKTNIIFCGVWPEVKDYLKKNINLKNSIIKIYTDHNLPKKVDKNIEILSTFIETKVDKNTFEKMPNLKLVATMSTGFDHIDLNEASRRGITVVNVPSYGENTVAEQAMALILALSKKIYPGVQRVKNGSFDYKNLTGIDLKNKTIGVIGTGKIGAHLIRMALAFEMKVVAYDPFPNNELAKKFNFNYVDFESLLSQSDFISLHVPLNKDTQNLINHKNIKKIKSGACLINTARGGLIEPTALLSALKAKRLGGVGLDVMEEEDIMKKIKSAKTTKEKMIIKINKEIIKNERVLVTPHNAFNTTEALQRIMDTTINNIKNFLSGQTINEVKK